MTTPPWLEPVRNAATPTDSFWLEKSVLTEGFQDATPLVLPPEPGARTTADLVDEAVDRERDALTHRLDPILARWPDARAAILAAWEAEWDTFRTSRAR